MLGICALASLLAGLFFLRFWRDTRDRFFLYFAVAFGIEAVNWTVIGLAAVSPEAMPYIYLARLFSFLLILGAIVDKNRKKPAAAQLPKGQTEKQS
jgi:hypothetical protein